MPHTIHPASLTPLDVEADFVSHQSSCKPACFTPLAQGADLASHHTSCELHTTHPAILQASHHTFCRPILLHTARPASLHASHHSSCERHITHPASFTPHILQACMVHTTRPGSRFRFTPLVLRASHHMPCKVSIERQSQFWISCHIVRCPAPRCTTRPSANTLLPSPAETTFLMTAPSFEALATPNFGYTLTIPLLVPCRHNLRATLASRLLTTPPSPGDTTFSW